jgi:hypothetical protein
MFVRPNTAFAALTARRSGTLNPMRTVLILAVLLPSCTLDAASEPVAAARQPLTAVEYAPESTLLTPGTTSVSFTLKTDAPTACRFSVGADGAYAGMKAFASGDGTADHGATFDGLSADPLVVNDVFVRCDADPSFVLHLQYRSLSQPNPSYPRTGNLWGWWGVAQKGMDHAARIDLYLGAGATKDEIVQLRTLNPNILVLTDINTVEEGAPDKTGLPESYYLKDTNGKPIEVWPGAFRVNITKPEVVAFKAREAWQTIADTGFMADGCFFDNFLLMPSWLTHDMWGNPVQVDADEDGVADDPKVMDAAWRKGAIAEVQAFRKLMPDAYVSGHAIFLDAEVGPLFNGEGIGFMSSDVIEGEEGFPQLWNRYQDWWKLGRKPVITMLESSARDDIAYGFSYEPDKEYPPATLEFARTYYPDMRFGLAFTLMGDGFFAHEIGDTWHGNDWWYDELDYNLGQPCGPAARVDLGTTPTTNLVDNGSFEQPLSGTWSSWVNDTAGAAAIIAIDPATGKQGAASLLADVTNAGEAVSWHIAAFQSNRSLEKGKLYDLIFWAKADSKHKLTVNIQKGSADWDDYGLSQAFELSQDWVEYTASFESNVTASDARLGINFGSNTGKVWIDDVRLQAHPPDVMAREFTNGKAILNATREWRTVPAGQGFSRLQGDQAPRIQYLLDDVVPAFTVEAGWNEVQYDSGEWTAVGPFYHDWGPAMHRLDGATGNAEWKLDVRVDDTYTIQAWWPAGPDATGFTKQAVYEVVAGGAVMATKTLDQSVEGNQWHTIAEVALTAAGSPLVRLHNGGTGAAIADALHVYSSARLNDGTEAASVDLGPMDGIVLRRTSGTQCIPAAGGTAGAAGASGAAGAAGSAGPDSGAGGADAGDDPAQGESSDDGGCGCHAAGSRAVALGWVALAFAMLVRRRMRA